MVRSIFFLLTGFYLPSQRGFIQITNERLQRISTIALIANILYLPLAIAVIGWQVFSPAVFSIGTWFHLWFLNAMVFAFIIIPILPRLLRKPLFIDLLSIGLVSAFYIADVAAMSSSPESGDILFAMRHLAAPAFIWLGFRATKIAPKNLHIGAMMIGAGILLIAIETAFWDQMGYSMIGRQLPAGAIIVAAGLLFVGNYIGEAPDWLAHLGRNAVLPIYILHPVFLKFAKIIFSLLPTTGEAEPYLTLLLGLISTVLVTLGAFRLWPFLADILSGKIPNPSSFRSHQ